MTQADVKSRKFPTGLPLVDSLRSCMLMDRASGGCSGLPYQAAELIHDLYDALDPVNVRIASKALIESGHGLLGGLLIIMADKQEAALAKAVSA